MQSLSIWHWLILAILAVLVVCAFLLFARAINKRRPDDRSVREIGTATPVSGPSGFRGWLLLVAIGVCVSPILTIVKLTKIEDGGNDSFTQEFHLMYDGDRAIHVAVIVIEICTIIAMVSRSRNFVSFYIWTLVCASLLPPAEIAWMKHSSVGTRANRFCISYKKW